MLKNVILLAVAICPACTWMQTHPKQVEEIESAAEAVAEGVLGEPGKLGVELIESVVNDLDKTKKGK